MMRFVDEEPFRCCCSFIRRSQRAAEAPEVCAKYIIVKTMSNRERHENLNVLYVIDLNDEVKQS